MRKLKNELKNRTIDYNKLIKFGFFNEQNNYIYKTNILNGQFEIYLSFKDDQAISRLIDIENDEEYVLVDIEGSAGEFVGKVREEYEKKLHEIIENCTSIEIFKNKQTKEIIKYVKEKYNGKLEFLWEKFEDTAIWRNKQNNKWYGLLMNIPKSKLGIDSEEKLECIDLRFQKGEVDKIIDNDKIYPGYHMNKNSWITVKLDDSLNNEDIFELIDNSYELSLGSKSSITGKDLSQRVLDYLTTIPKGKVVTYKQVAEHLENKGLARAVGNILHKNPDGEKYPCYKVLNSKGELAEAFVFGGKEVQKQRLEKEGIKVIDNKVDLKKYQFVEKNK